MNNQIQALAMLPKMSEQQLIQALQTGSAMLPAYAVMAELQARKKRAAGLAKETPATTVKQDMTAQAGGLQALAPQQASVQPPMQQPMPKAPGMAGGGLVYKHPHPLKDDETFLVPYSDLSRGEKEELDLARRREAARLEALAEKQRRDYILASVLSAPGRALYGDMGRPIVDTSVETRRRAAAVQDERFQKPRDNVLYGDTVPHKLPRGGLFSRMRNDNLRAEGMAGGGLVGDAYEGYALEPEPEQRAAWWDRFQKWRAAQTPIGIAGPGMERPDGSFDAAQRAALGGPPGIPRGRTEPGPPRYTTQRGIAPPSRQQLEAGPLRTAPVPAPVAKTAPTGIRNAGATPSAKPFESTSIALRSIKDAMGDIPADNSVEEQIAAIKASDTSAKDKKIAIGEALLRAGSTMMQRPGSFLSALGAGAGEGLTSLQYSNRQIQQDQNERRKELGALAIAKGRQGLERYDVANRTRFGEAGVEDRNRDNLFQAYKVAVESGDRAAQRQTEIQVAGIRAAAEKASQKDYNMQRLVQTTQAQASDDFDKLAMSGLNQVKYSQMSPEQYNRERQAYIAERLRTIPGIEQYWVAPPSAGQTGGLTDKPAGKVLTLQ